MSIILILFLLLFSPSWSKREPVDGPCVYHHLLMCFLRTSSNTLSIGVTESLDQRINTNDSGRVAGGIAPIREKRRLNPVRVAAQEWRRPGR